MANLTGRLWSGRMTGSINSNQTLTANVSGSAGKYILPIASQTTLGGVKIDMTTITITEDGTISVIGGTGAIHYDTTANWNAQATLIGVRGDIYIYSDYKQIEVDGQMQYIPGFKVGDGNAYLIDNPFTDAQFESHINNTEIHTSAAEKDFWDHKMRCYIAGDDDEELVFTEQ